MKAIVITKHGGHDALEVHNRPEPHPGPGEVRIQVKAAGLNFAEVMARKGLYPDAPKTPFVAGYEAAGVVDAVGIGVEGLEVGDRVTALSRFGAHASLLCVPASQALPISDAMTFEEAAAIPANYVTAYHMLFRVGALRPGETVLVHMAAGGVGIAALQLCRTVPDVTVFGTSSASKHAILSEQGCTHPIDYRTKDYAAEIRRLTDNRGVDVVLDALGGADWKKGYDLLRPAGRLIAFGFANLTSGHKRSIPRVARQFLSMPRFSPLQLMNDNKTVTGVNIGHLWDETPMLVEQLHAVLKLYDTGAVKPIIDSVFPFAEAARAHERIESRQNVGKVVLVP